MNNKGHRAPLLSAGFLLGVGLGGFLDGIVLHQIFQLHNMLSGRRPPNTLANVEINMVWDGVFHAFCWLTTVLGVFRLWSAMNRQGFAGSGRTLLGSMILGWGSFNLVEGVIDHHVLRIHNVVQSLGVSIWDYAFLAIGGVGLMLAGWAMLGNRTGRES